MKKLISAVGLALLLSSPILAQNTNRFSFVFGGGFTQPVRFSEDRLNTGFNFLAGGGVNVSKHVGLLGEFGFNHMGLSTGTLAAQGVPDGSTRIYSFTFNPVVRMNPEGRFDPYITFGGGYYRRTVEFTAPTTAVVSAFDPFYGVFFPIEVPANEILGSFSQNKGGANVGAGFSVRISGDSNVKLFAEARGHYIWTTPVRTTYVPVSFGLRW